MFCMMSERFFSRAAACFAATLLVGGAASAADFPLRTALGADSPAHGVGRPDLPLLRVSAGAGAGRTLQALTGRFASSPGAVTTDGQPKVEVRKERTIATWADGRILTVHGDGTKVSFRNPEELNGSTPVAVAQRLSSDRLAQIGRQFIQKELADFIRLGTGEKLEPFSTRVQVGGGADVMTIAPPVEEVLSNEIVFTRTVDGVPVLGGGSKVALLITNEGRVAGFDFDWAQYQPTGRRVKALAATQIQERVRALGSVKLDSPGVSVKRYECGLFDAGLRHRDPQAPLQGACVIQATERRIADPVAHLTDPASGHVVSATVDVIPVGETVEPDSRWPQAQALLGRGGARFVPAGPGPRP